MPEFAGKTVWVLGGSGGLGGEIARAFLSEGATVFLSGRNQERLRAEAGAYADRGQAVVMPIEVTKQSEVDSAASNIMSRTGRIDILINSTSISRFADFLALDDAAWRDIFEAKLFAYVRTMRAVLPHMLARKSGAIVNVSGNSGKFPKFPAHIAGASGNAAVNVVTKAVADLYFSKGIRINSIAPGPILSPRMELLSRSESVARESSSEPDAREQIVGKPQDVANAALFLCSERSRHVNGIVLTVDGGITPTVG